MRRIFYDTEFIDDGKTIELISIGMVDDQGDELYYINSDCNFDNVVKNKWLRENVLPYIPTVDNGWDTDNLVVKSKSFIARKVADFIIGIPELVIDKNSEFKPELWAYFSAFDHVALSWLWGRMINMPSGIPFYTHDLKQEMDRLGVTKEDLKEFKNVNTHKAIDDARWNREVFNYLQEV